MKSMLTKTLVVLFALIVQNQLLQAQQYSINGSLGLDTIPEYKLDVNGDGHFRGELLLDDDLRLLKLASTDSLLQKLLYVDENGRMNRLGEGGARTIGQILHTLPCFLESGETEPTVTWNAVPGKIYAFADYCDFTPNVGIGTDDPKARLDVRGTSYFTQNMGLGTINVGEARLVIRGTGSGILMRTTYHDGNGLVDKDVFEVKTNGRIETKGMGASQHALSIKHDGSDEENVIITGDGRTHLRGMSGGSNAFEIKSGDNETTTPNFIVSGDGRIAMNGMQAEDYTLRIKHDGSDEENVIITGDGRTRLRGMSVASDALIIQNNESLQPNVVIKGNGHIQQNVSGEWSDHVISITDADTDNEVFFVKKNGEIKMQHLTNGNHVLTAAIHESGYDNVVIRADGSIDLSLDGDGSDKAFNINNMSLPAGGPQDVFHIRENGTMLLRYTGTDEFQDVLRIKSEDQDGNIFRIDGKGRVLAASVHVRELGNFNFPDYVFEPGYELMPLEKLRRYIAENQRLPNMPSAEEVKRSGVDLGEMNRLLVEKVEELTLYVLQLEERLKAVEAK